MTPIGFPNFHQSLPFLRFMSLLILTLLLFGKPWTSYIIPGFITISIWRDAIEGELNPACA